MKTNVVGKNIRILRIRGGMTAKDLGKKIGCSANCVYMWESCQRRIHTEELIKLSKLFDVTLDELMTKEMKLCVVCNKKSLPRDVSPKQA